MRLYVNVDGITQQRLERRARRERDETGEFRLRVVAERLLAEKLAEDEPAETQPLEPVA